MMTFNMTIASITTICGDDDDDDDDDDDEEESVLPIADFSFSDQFLKQMT